ncbi:MAG: AAA family ATPase [Brumimicrobium sp.]|nr:AAA family ATPase [Brumimicrobium sp.]
MDSPLEHSYKKVFLTGFMGSGKTKLGKMLARKLAYNFYDVDEEITLKLQLSINDIFKKLGEPEFRNQESVVLKAISNLPENAIISTGGGLPCYNDNMGFINKIGTSIYLERSPRELFQRLLTNRGERPLIKDLTENELLDYITQTLSSRSSYYEMATFIVGREEQTPEELVKLLKENNKI